jgi:cytochrome c biogenesis protein CcmG/thiol:disulfide interchange protein DsbE
MSASARNRGGWSWLGTVIAVNLAAVAFLFINSGGKSLTGGALSGPAVGSSLGNWKLQPLTAGSRPLSSDELEGQVVLLNFWGTWCGPCRAEFPHLAELAHRLAKVPDFTLVAVSCGGQDSDVTSLRQNTTAFLVKGGFTLPTYCDPGAATRSRVPGMRGYPCTLVLDRQGVIRGMWSGYGAGYEVQMEQLVNQLLRNTSAPRQRGAGVEVSW